MRDPASANTSASSPAKRSSATNIVKDFLAGIRDIVGGRSGAYEKALRTAREESLRDMATEARARGADAVIGVDLDYEVLGTGNGMLMVTTSGTAVALE